MSTENNNLLAKKENQEIGKQNKNENWTEKVHETFEDIMGNKEEKIGTVKHNITKENKDDMQSYGHHSNENYNAKLLNNQNEDTGFEKVGNNQSKYEEHLIGKPGKDNTWGYSTQYQQIWTEKTVPSENLTETEKMEKAKNENAVLMNDLNKSEDKNNNVKVVDEDDAFETQKNRNIKQGFTNKDNNNQRKQQTNRVV